MRVVTFVVGVLLLIIGALLELDWIESADLEEYKFWIAWAGGAILALGALSRGL